MKGFIYRLGVRIKEIGENANLAFLIKLGLGIRTAVIKRGGK